MTRRRLFWFGSGIVFMAIFNLGYLFHDVLLGDWFHAREREIVRDHYLIPIIALAFAVYALVLAYLFPIYRREYPRRSAVQIGWVFGLLMGVVFDALQGGLIEVATFRMPWSVFAVDSGYHVLIEGSVAGLILGWCHGRWGIEPAVPTREG